MSSPAAAWQLRWLLSKAAMAVRLLPIPTSCNDSAAVVWFVAAGAVFSVSDNDSCKGGHAGFCAGLTHSTSQLWRAIWSMFSGKEEPITSPQPCPSLLLTGGGARGGSRLLRVRCSCSRKRPFGAVSLVFAGTVWYRSLLWSTAWDRSLLVLFRCVAKRP